MKIYNAEIFTMEDTHFSNGFVEFENGVITAVGDMTDCPEIADTDVDAKGMRVYPGFIDAHTHLGMWEDGLGFEGDDGNEDTDPSTPHLRAIDAINPDDFCFEEALKGGVTTVLTGPGSANPIGGQIAAVKTMGCRIDNMLVDKCCGVKFALGENPKSVYHGKNQTPVTRMATAAIIREQLNKAKRYMQDLDNAENSEDEDKPEYDIKCEALLPVVKGEKYAFFHAHRVDDIFTAARIAQEFYLKYIIIHGTLGYKAVKELKQLDVGVLCGPTICDRSKPELKGLTPECAGILSNAGIETAIITDHPVIPIQYLPLCAAVCVRDGMDYDTALKAITITPAKICGIDNKVGSIKVGKDADFVLYNGDPLNVMNKPQMVFCGGKRA
ncbi:MAG: amidohydrolase [Clostridia bacterium]|nr:amidohydrolase [Clostridia bacterium]